MKRPVGELGGKPFMSTSRDAFLSEARRLYVESNKAALSWVMDRPLLGGAFLNTKQDSVSLNDYSESDAWRGPNFLYGWIQGRGLEALVMHARFFDREDPSFANRLDQTAERVYRALKSLYDRYDAAYFCYGDLETPIYQDSDGAPQRQLTGTRYFTYSDVFVLKGLIAASMRYDRTNTSQYVAKMRDLVQAIEMNRFITDESSPLDRKNLERQPGEFGPRMIVLGAAAMLRRLGLDDAAAFGDRFIDYVFKTHWDIAGKKPSGLLLDTVGGDHCNVGHGIEFGGFALEYLPSSAPSMLVADIERLIVNSFHSGFTEPGICLRISAETGQHLSPYFPWWPLPEAVRAAALCFTRTGNIEVLDIWKSAHDVFFDRYWRGAPAIAYQTRDAQGPVDYVPATPDLDPGYHTGLSLLAAIEVIDSINEDLSSENCTVLS